MPQRISTSTRTSRSGKRRNSSASPRLLFGTGIGKGGLRRIGTPSTVTGSISKKTLIVCCEKSGSRMDVEMKNRVLGQWELNRTHNVDCAEGLRGLPADSIDVI